MVSQLPKLHLVDKLGKSEFGGGGGMGWGDGEDVNSQLARIRK